MQSSGGSGPGPGQFKLHGFEVVAGRLDWPLLVPGHAPVAVRVWRASVGIARATGAATLVWYNDAQVCFTGLTAVCRHHHAPAVNSEFYFTPSLTAHELELKRERKRCNFTLYRPPCTRVF